MSNEKAPEVPDLKSLLREASRPAAECTVPLKQGLADAIRRAEDELQSIAVDAKSKRAAGKSPVRAKAEEVEALRREMKEAAGVALGRHGAQPPGDQP